MKRKISRSCYAHPDQDQLLCYEWLASLILEFQTLGLLNDDAYLKGILNSLRNSKGLSKRMIVLKLREKGFPESQVLDVLSSLEENSVSSRDAEIEAALRYAHRKKLGPYQPVPPRKNHEQQMASLSRAGFSYDICKVIMEYEVSE
jgi:regulatory protein